MPCPTTSSALSFGIAAGTYYETVIPPRDGVTYTGERAPNGEWQTIIDASVDPSTIIDPSTHVSNTWTSELLDGVTVWLIVILSNKKNIRIWRPRSLG
jgi:hypothetical protein